MNFDRQTSRSAETIAARRGLAARVEPLTTAGFSESNRRPDTSEMIARLRRSPAVSPRNSPAILRACSRSSRTRLSSGYADTALFPGCILCLILESERRPHYFLR